MKLTKLSLVIIAALLFGCAQNPVTQKNELSLVSQDKEIKIGNQHYQPAQQMNGGLYTADPALTAYVQQVGQKLAKVSHRNDLPFQFVVLNDSTPNAWALPGGKIAINRGLLIELNSEAELAAVLGHEITHATARHGAKAMERQTAMAAGLGVLQVIIASKSDDESTQDMAAGAAALTAALVTTKYGRDAEREADHYGIDYMVKAGYDPKAAVHLQQTFVRLMDKKDQHWLKGLFASHPPSKERLKANQVYAQTFPHTNLTLGQTQYQEKIARLKQSKPAYDMFDEAQQKLKNKRYDDALALIEKAIEKEPNEAHFYALKGDILAKQNKTKQSIDWYTKAIDKNNNYYYFYLQRGLAFEKNKQAKLSKQDLKKSQALLPTESAQLALRRIALKGFFVG